jgi:hypothetical protein
LGGAADGAALFYKAHCMNIEQQLLDIRQRNEQRVKGAIEQLGTKYLLHPSNYVKKVDVKKGTLSDKRN